MSVIRMLLFVASWQNQHLLVKKNKNQKWIPFEIVSNVRLIRPLIRPTIPILNWPLVIPFPERSGLWSFHPQTEVTSDHTIPRPNWPLIIPSPDRSDLWIYYCALELIPRPCNFGLGSYNVRRTWLIRGHFRMAAQPGFSSCCHFWLGLQLRTEARVLSVSLHCIFWGTLCRASFIDFLFMQTWVGSLFCPLLSFGGGFH